MVEKIEVQKTISEASLVSAAEKAAENVLKYSTQINESRQLTEDVAGPMAHSGLFRLLVTKSAGGHEIDYLTMLKIVNIIAQADGSVAWCLNQNNVLGTLSAFMPKDLSEEIWSDQRAILSNGPPIGASAIPVKNGYILNGRWNFSSGSQHATWVVALTPVPGRKSADNKTDEMRNFILPKSEVNMLDVWHVNGLRGTGSYSFEVHDLFVPERRSFVDGNPPLEDGPLYIMPKTLLFCSGFATASLGIARSALDSVIGLSEAKTPQDQELLMKQSFTQREVGIAEAIWRSAKSYLQDSADAIWESVVNRGELPENERIDLRLSSTHAIREAVKVADMAYSICGSSAIFESTPIQRKYQDVRVISQQIQGRMAHYDTAGRYFLGIDPRSRLY